MSDTLLLANATVVLADRVLEGGWLAVADGRIVEAGVGRAPAGGVDLGGDLLIPGLVELHTDHLEAHFMPRPEVHWDPISAVVSYDAQLATSGVTTVLDSLRIWREESMADTDAQSAVLADAITLAREAGMLRVEHYLHLRCEIPARTVAEEALGLLNRDDVRLMSLMDHTPGQRQFRDEEKLRAYYRGKSGMNDAALDVLFEHRRRLAEQHAEDNRRRLVVLAHDHGTTLASHDDTTLDHVEEAVRDGIAIAEFPTTAEAARALHAAGIKVLMGAPNLVRGGSHSGNVAAIDLARAGVLDALSSDYVPSSLLMAAIALPGLAPNIDLPAAIRTVTKTPAEAVGFSDRGEIAQGRRADLVRVRVQHGVPVVRAVWRTGERVI